MSNMVPLINAGPDAFSNLFDVRITFPTLVVASPTPDFRNSISVRIKDFPFPTFNPQPYNVSYKSVTLKRFAPKIEMNRKLTLNFRLDSQWDIYRAFKSWKSLYVDESTSNIKFSNYISTPGILTNYGKIEVVSYVGNQNLNTFEAPLASANNGPKWSFNQVACMNVNEPEFTRDTANPLSLSVEFMFGQYVPPGETAPVI
jgi:hypothetical protein